MRELRRLADIEATRRKEEREAAAWMREHSAELPPVIEGWERRVVMPDGSVRRLVVHMPEGSDGWREVWEEAGKWLPMVSHEAEVNPTTALLRKRVQHVLGHIKEKHVYVLTEHYVKGRSVVELADEDLVTKQTMAERLGWARKAFAKAWLAHADESMDVAAEDL